jgi:tetratricopeptide (TPR) repeat protein
LASERKELLGDIEQCSKVLNFEQALVLYKEASDLKPNKIEVYLKLGRTYERIKDYEEAISNFKKALRRNKKSFMAWYRMGLACMKCGLRKDGIEALLKAYKIDPDNVSCLVKLGEIYSRDDKKML